MIRTSYKALRCLHGGSKRFNSSLGKGSLKKTAINKEEMSHFNALAASWWDVDGPQRILHKMNLLRMDFIHSTIREHLKLNEGITEEEDRVYIPPYSLDLLPKTIRTTIQEEQDDRRDDILMSSNFQALDVGCGGGILTESMARLPFIDSIKGIDLSSDVLEAAKVHMQKDPNLVLENKLSYELTAIEDLPANEKYDIITMFEMLEHVNYPCEVLDAALSRVKKGGWLFISTINRDFISWFTTIFMGEHLLRIVPVGTHSLEKYIDHEEIKQWITKNPEKNEQFKVVKSEGCIYLPAYGWKFTKCPDIGNYFMAIQRQS